MGNYSINLGTLKSELAQFVSTKNQFRDMYQSYYQYSFGVDSVWKDVNTAVFQSHMKSELKRLDEFSECLEECTKEVYQFIDQLVAIFQRSGCTKNEFDLQFNEDLANHALNDIIGVQEQLNDITTDLRSISIPSSSSARSEIFEMARIYSEMLSNIDILLRNYRNVIQGVVDLISLTKSRMEQIEPVRILDNQLKFIWDVSSSVGSMELTSSVDQISSAVKDSEVEKIKFVKPEVQDVSTLDANDEVETLEIRPQSRGGDVSFAHSTEEVEEEAISVSKTDDISFQNSKSEISEQSVSKQGNVSSATVSGLDQNLKVETINDTEVNDIRTSDSTANVGNVDFSNAQVQDVSTHEATSNVSVQNIDVGTHAEAEVGNSSAEVVNQDIHVNDVQEITAKDILDTVKPID